MNIQQTFPSFHQNENSYEKLSTKLGKQYQISSISLRIMSKPKKLKREIFWDKNNF